MSTNELIIIILVIPILLAQGIWLYVDAKRRGTYAWAWGIVGLIQFPTPLLLYYVFIIRKDKRR
ncbi:transcriptional regulator [Terribacillus saccharophilus]|uniref:Transcriptional regulator n=1 Tax=Terribacillus saccharophilus TaxID=361277 RepID=A0A268A6N8_9BACI|nr:transcriptional regulator [Terribacillus saccharophilus]PAD19749.1 transcriptional regulator [Terribacillus saccharophilus]PAF16190.1 transcriptional regulator [Terribacillus saccharophilus]PAF20138.1 transcriptional regulator [Terribacillus saccharophilus]PAF34584.1 transcriptional regulator [Terribacillus saccharophilus]PAF35198.1 transcriptional regulator [Terribacillus saccharophilus]